MKAIYYSILFISSFSAIAQDNEFHLDKVYHVSKNGTIDLSSSDGKVFITGSLRPDAHVKIDRKVITTGWVRGEQNFKVDVEETNGNLLIRERSTSNIVMVGSYREEYRIEIEVPDGVNLKINGDDGDYYIKSIHGEIVMNLDDADAELSNCNGNKFEFRLDDGDLRMDKGRGSLSIKADDADVEIHQANFTSIHADVDDGDLIIETSLANNGKYDFSSQDGLIALNVTSGGGNFDIRHDDGHVITTGNFKTTYESEDHTKTSLGNGTAEVSVRADDARVKLTAK
jgi:hypothetical protein